MLDVAPLGPPTPMLAAAASAFLLRDSALGRALSPSMLAFCLAFSLSNANLLPSVHPLYDWCATSALPFSVCLGLLSATDAGSDSITAAQSVAPFRPMLAAFAIGAIGSTIGALIAYILVCRSSLLAPSAAACTAALMCATYVGGSANFFAVAAATQASSRHAGLIPSLLAADLALMGLYLLALTAMARSPLAPSTVPAAEASTPSQSLSPGAHLSHVDPETQSVPVGGLQRAFRQAPAVCGVGLVAAAVCAVAKAIEATIQVPGSGIVTISMVSSVASAALSRWRPHLAATVARPLGDAALALGCLFLASIGASARLAELVVAGPSAALFAAVVLAVHCVVMVGGVALANRCGLRIPIEVVLIASNANIGGSVRSAPTHSLNPVAVPVSRRAIRTDAIVAESHAQPKWRCPCPAHTCSPAACDSLLWTRSCIQGTAVAMAGAMGWKQLVAPAATAGAIGYAAATGLGVGLYALLAP